ncbi:protein kinase [Gemmatirosa kalamazoonensis]|uniref:non-specific serine/threonine protein kinase n=1 Tax=Gemmatirosa kalamazoonensis TaxID=861299 RepID=W0RBC7_9BACT|nr:protein kinase [Gemmatirosa kalamazoonensis]AHG88404.1 protein kinase [Gemmatirosa kalamazoonensis]
MEQNDPQAAADLLNSGDALRAALKGRYVVQRELGRGGMATVYLAEDREQGRTVAVKLLRQELSFDTGIERFRREIEHVGRLNHPNIVPIYDAGDADGRLFYVMPFVEGESLRQLLVRRGQLPLEEAVRFVVEAGEALAYAHEQGLVHRDIKPENLLISRGHALVCDFGVARAVDESNEARLTATGLAVGTSAYMSPEQWGETRRIDGAADQYSLACVLYELLAGEPPFMGPTPHAIMARHFQAPVPSVCILRPGVPMGVDQAIQRALAKVPADRFPSIGAFLDAVRAGVAGGVTYATPLQLPVATDTPSASAARPAPAWRRPVLAVVAAAVLGVAGFLAARQLRHDAPAAGESPRIAVLPFRGDGATADPQLADGTAEAITDELAGISGLRVIAYSSTKKYRDSQLSHRDIARELDVGYLVEGTVRWLGANDSVHLSARLVRAADDELVKTFSFDVPSGSATRIHSQLAANVAEALDIVLVGDEQRRLTSRQTRSAEAFEYLVRGNAAYNRSWSRADVLSALDFYQKAVDTDPTFALAQAKLARTHAWIHRLRIGPGEARLLAAKQAADRALALDPNLAEGHIALGLYYYWGRQDYERAIQEFTRAGQLQPSDAEVFLQLGNVSRRQGKFREAIESYRRSAELDPNSARAWFNLGETLLFIRQYAEARKHLEHATALAPDFLEAYTQRMRLVLNERGDVAAARDILRTAEERVPPNAWRPPMVELTRVIRHPNLDEFLAKLRPGAYGLDTALYHLEKGTMLWQLQRLPAARVQLDSARVRLERLRDDQPDQSWIYQSLAVAEAGLGHADAAVRAASRGEELQPPSKDALEGVGPLSNFGTVYAMLGDARKSAVYFDSALARPSWASVAWLRTEPMLAGVRNDPAFQQLFARWERR